MHGIVVSRDCDMQQFQKRVSLDLFHNNAYLCHSDYCDKIRLYYTVLPHGSHIAYCTIHHVCVCPSVRLSVPFLSVTRFAFLTFVWLMTSA